MENQNIEIIIDTIKFENCITLNVTPRYNMPRVNLKFSKQQYLLLNIDRESSYIESLYTLRGRYTPGFLNGYV